MLFLTKSPTKTSEFICCLAKKKVRDKDSFDFVKAEIYHLKLQLDSYSQDFYKNLEKRYQ